MLILGVESATGLVGCALGDHGGVLAAVQATRERHHAELLAPQISFICEQAGVRLQDVAVVAVDVGPGLYTGLRVGVTTAITIAHALRIPMVGVSSLDLLAFPLRHISRPIDVVMDARRSEVFHARFRPVPGGVQRVSEPIVALPDEVVSEIIARGEEALVVGDGVDCHQGLFEGLSGVDIADRGFAHPSAESLVQLAHASALREEFVRPDQIEPLYLRQPDAEAKWTSTAKSAP